MFSFLFFWIPSVWTALKKKKKKCFNDIVEYFYASLMGRLKKWSRGWKKTYLACVIDLSIHRRLACECHGLPHLALKVHGCMKRQYQQGAIMAWVKVKYSPQSKNAYIEKVKHRTFTWVTDYSWTSDKCWSINCFKESVILSQAVMFS